MIPHRFQLNSPSIRWRYLGAFQRQIPAGAPTQIRSRIEGLIRREFDHPAIRQRRLPFPIIQIQGAGLQGLIHHGLLAHGFGIPPHRFSRVEIFLDGLRPLDPPLIRLVIERHHGPGHSVEQSFQTIMEQGQPMLGPGGAASVSHCLVQGVIFSGGAKLCRIPRLEPGNGPIVQDHFVGRVQRQTVRRPHRALGQGVKKAGSLQRLTEQIQPYGLGVADGEDIDNTAAHRVFTELAHGADPLVAVPVQISQQSIQFQGAPHRGEEASTGKRLPGRNTLHSGVDCGEQNSRGVQLTIPCSQLAQGLRSLTKNGVAGGNPVIGHAIPGWKTQHRNIGGEESQRLGHGVGPGIAGGDVDDAACGLPGK